MSMEDLNNLGGGIGDLKLEFDKFVQERCVTAEEEKAEEDEAEVPGFVNQLTEKLLAPAHAGVFLSRLDIKRVAEAIDESLPIKERKKMLEALMRHTVKKDYLRLVFDEFSRHINGRILIYKELGDEFKASTYIFDGYIEKAEKLQKMFNRIVEDFEEIEPTDDPLII